MHYLLVTHYMQPETLPWLLPAGGVMSKLLTAAQKALRELAAVSHPLPGARTPNLHESSV